MSTCLAIDAAPAAPSAVWVDGRETVHIFSLDRVDLASLPVGGQLPDRIVHRFPHAPAGVPEIAVPLDPSHLTAAGALEPDDTAARLAALDTARARWPYLPHYLVFDTPWFDDLPDLARHYGIPPETESKLGLQRVGRHGPVHRLAVRETRGRRVVSLFLGDESSAAAVVDGVPVECSAGATGLEGLPGAYTCGDVDPAALLYLMDNLGESLDRLVAAVSREGGWSGLAGATRLGELRRLQTAAADDALALVIDRCRRVIGAFAAVMDGLDAIVVSGAAEDVDAALVDDIVAGLDYLGVPDRVAVTRTSLTPALAAAIATG